MNIRKNLDRKKLLTCVVGANDILINYPEHDKNYNIYHKKKFKKNLYEKKV